MKKETNKKETTNATTTKNTTKKEKKDIYTFNNETLNELATKYNATLKDHQGTTKSVIVKFNKKPLLEVLQHADNKFTIYAKIDVVKKAKMQKAFTNTKYFISEKRTNATADHLEKLFQACQALQA